MWKQRIWWGLVVSILGFSLVGWYVWAQSQPNASIKKSAVKSAQKRPATHRKAKYKPLTTAQKHRRAADRTDGVGQVLRTHVGDSRIPYQLANSHVKLYDSLQHVNNRYHVTVDGDEEELAPPIKVVIAKTFETTRGTYCLIQTLKHVATSKPFEQVQAQTWTKLTPSHDWGYIAFKDLKPTTYQRAITSLPKRPYYLTTFEGKDPSNLAMNLGRTTVHAWSQVPGTVFRAFAHDTDTLLNQQFYAVKRLVRTDGRVYLLLQTATGKTVGWLPAESQLVAGIYQPADQVLLKPQATETVQRAVQSKPKSVANSGYLSRSRVTWVTRQHHLNRVLILTAMNTPIKLSVAARCVRQITFYQPNRRRHRVITVHFKAGHNQRTYACDNAYGDAGTVTVYQHSARLASFSDGDDSTDEEGYTASGTLWQTQRVTFKSGLWSNQDD